MIAVKNDFNRRKQEINLYFNFLEKILTHDYITWSSTDRERVSIDFRGIVKANIFLMLYNLAESSISGAIEQIHLSIKNDTTVSFDNIKDGIKTKLIKYLKNKKSAEKFILEVNNISFDIITSCFDKKTVFSGNTDREEIIKLARHYGFSFDSDYSKTKHGEKLLTIKNHRNELAHGDVSFQEIGKEYTLSDIEEYKNEVIAYLEQIILNIELYINNKEYKK